MNLEAITIFITGIVVGVIVLYGFCCALNVLLNICNGEDAE